jgi:hypothetical protein
MDEGDSHLVQLRLWLHEALHGPVAVERDGVEEKLARVEREQERAEA